MEEDPTSVANQGDKFIAAPRLLAQKHSQQIAPSPTSQITTVAGRAKRRRIVSDPDLGLIGKGTEIQVKREHVLTGLKNATNDRHQALAEKTLETGTAMEIEITIPTTGDIATTTDLLEEGEDSPERAAVESAIGAQDDEGMVVEEANETSGSKKRSRRTYGKKRYADDLNQTTITRDETPTLDSSSTHAPQHTTEGTFLATPQSGRLVGNASNSYTPSYATRARSRKSNKADAQSHLAQPDHSSPSMTTRHHGQGNMIQGEKNSPATVKVKEEVHDPAADGRPRIVGGDDEGESNITFDSLKIYELITHLYRQMTRCVSNLWLLMRICAFRFRSSPFAAPFGSTSGLKFGCCSYVVIVGSRYHSACDVQELSRAITIAKDPLVINHNATVES